MDWLSAEFSSLCFSAWHILKALILYINNKCFFPVLKTHSWAPTLEGCSHGQWFDLLDAQILLLGCLSNEKVHECGHLDYIISHVTIAFTLTEVLLFSVLLCHLPCLNHCHHSCPLKSPTCFGNVWLPGSMMLSNRCQCERSLDSVLQRISSAAHSQLHFRGCLVDYNEGISYKALGWRWSVHVCFSSFSSSVCLTRRCSQPQSRGYRRAPPRWSSDSSGTVHLVW